jgi:hypothetical protein
MDNALAFLSLHDVDKFRFPHNDELVNQNTTEEP